MPAESLRSLFASLHALHTLQLLYSKVDAVLPLVSAIPSIRHLLLFHIDDYDDRPSAAILSTLQAAMPQLRITNGLLTQGHDTLPYPDDVHADQMVILRPRDCP